MIAVEKSWGRYVTFPKIKNYELESKKIEQGQDEEEETEDTAVCELVLLDLTSKKTRRSLNKRALKRVSKIEQLSKRRESQVWFCTAAKGMM